MKRLIFILMAGLSLLQGTFAQTIDDALRYSQVFYGGTARFSSMGGAFTALGGDMSSLSQNPAGLGVFRSSEITLSPQLFHNSTTAGFNGTSSQDYLYNFNLSQAGIVTGLISKGDESGLISLNFGYSFNKTNNFHQTVRIQGVNNSSSMADYWASIGEGTNYKDLSGGSGIAYDTWIIDTLRGAASKAYGTVYSNYGDNPPSRYGQSVRRLLSNDGYTGEHAFSIGGNYANKIFFGATLGISRLKYSSHYEHMESTDASLPSMFKDFTYIDHYEDTGTGYTLKVGAIFKPVDFIRIGVAFHSPTWYHISEYFYEDITSHFTDGTKYESGNDPLRYNFALTTPFRLLGGVAVQIQKIGLISADYEFVDYSTAKFSQTGDHYDYTNKNSQIKDGLRPTSNFRLGGELRLNKLYLRTGYGYYGKAFRSGDNNDNLDYRTLSFGAGFREQNISIDLGFTNYKYSQSYFLYPLPNSFDPALASLNTVNNMFTVTVGYKFN